MLIDNQKNLTISESGDVILLFIYVDNKVTVLSSYLYTSNCLKF